MTSRRRSVQIMKDLYEFNKDRDDLIDAPSLPEESELSDESSVHDDDEDAEENVEKEPKPKKIVTLFVPNDVHGGPQNIDRSRLVDAVESVLGKRHRAADLEGHEMLKYLEVGACLKRIKNLYDEVDKEVALYKEVAKDIPMILEAHKDNKTQTDTEIQWEETLDNKRDLFLLKHLYILITIY